MSYENKELYSEYKRIKEAYLNSDNGIRISNSILGVTKKGYKITKKCNGLEYIYCFEGLAQAVLFLIKGQFEPVHLGTLKPRIVNNPVKIPCNLFSKK